MRDQIDMIVPSHSLVYECYILIFPFFAVQGLYIDQIHLKII
jgi:hypothetical protein